MSFLFQSFTCSLLLSIYFSHPLSFFLFPSLILFSPSLFLFLYFSLAFYFSTSTSLDLLFSTYSINLIFTILFSPTPPSPTLSLSSFSSLLLSFLLCPPLSLSPLFLFLSPSPLSPSSLLLFLSPPPLLFLPTPPPLPSPPLLSPLLFPSHSVPFCYSRDGRILYCLNFPV